MDIYNELDKQTREFILQKEKQIKGIVSDVYTRIGKELQEAQEKLSKRGYGLFGVWVSSCLGISRGHAYRLIYRYELISHHSNIAEYLEELPVSLLYEISKPSSESNLYKQRAKEAVLQGRVRTLKSFRTLKKSLEDADRTRKSTRQAVKRLETSYGDCIRCDSCGVDCTPIVDWHHIRPISLGGSNDPKNIAPLCPNCHAIVHRALSKRNDPNSLSTWIGTNYTSKAANRLLYLIEMAGAFNDEETEVVA
ncbi:HNH endonuclease [Bacillus subtilis]